MSEQWQSKLWCSLRTAVRQLRTRETPLSPDRAAQYHPAASTSRRRHTSGTTPLRNKTVCRCGHATPQTHPRAASTLPSSLVVMLLTAHHPFAVGGRPVCLVEGWRAPRSQNEESGEHTDATWATAVQFLGYE